MNLNELLAASSWEQATIVAFVIWLLPFLSGVLSLALRPLLHEKVDRLATALLGIATLLAGYLFVTLWGQPAVESQFTWFKIATERYDYAFTAGIFLDSLSVVLILVVSLIATLVHLYSIVYMRGDQGYNRYFAFLGFFTFAMLGIIVADNLLIIFIFWELVGLASYLLIGFWFDKPSAASAAKKAFIVNRIGDAGFLIGMLILWSQFGTLDINALKGMMGESDLSISVWNVSRHFDKVVSFVSVDPVWLTVAGIGLFCGTIGKSAQFPLQVWLPDAMEGPTPVSALIHAATMVAAGIYLLARIFVFLSLDVLTFIAFVGAITAFMGAFAAFTQHDIKKVLAFSTISQLGYMTMGMGVGAYDASLFHLITHAFFKACLFLSAGAIIHSMHHLVHKLPADSHFDPQDMRYMGGIARFMPFTFGVFLVSAAALSGLPFFSGFLSKDAILTGSMAWASALSQDGSGVYFLIPILGFTSALMTAIYMGRQVFLVFFGEFRLNKWWPNTITPSEAPLAMKIPLAILAVMSLGWAFSINPFSGADSWFMSVIKNPTFIVPVQTDKQINTIWAAYATGVGEYHHVTFWVSMGLAFAGILIAYLSYGPASRYARNYHPGYSSGLWVEKLSYFNWYLDVVYQALIVTPFLRLSSLFYGFDQKFVDRIINLLAKAHVVLAHIIYWIDHTFVDGVITSLTWLLKKGNQLLKVIQGGRVQSYLIWMILILVLLCLWLVF